jgi:hypothetical protein
MTPKEAFKIGFLEKCAADGLTPEETLLRIQHAKFMIKSASVGDAVGNFVGNISSAALPLILLGPPLAGVAGGAMLAKSPDDTYDKEEARKREIIAEYQRAVARMQALQQKQQAAGMM